MRLCANITLTPESKASGIQALERKPWHYRYQKSVKKGQEGGYTSVVGSLAYMHRALGSISIPAPPHPHKGKKREKKEKKGKGSFLAVAKYPIHYVPNISDPSSRSSPTPGNF